jgi:type II secretory pathway component PulF
MALSHSLRANWWAYLGGAAGLAAGLALFRNSPPGRAVIDRLAVSTPLVSRLVNKIFTCQLLRTLGHLLESHVPLLEALGMTRRTLGNRHFRDLTDRIAEHVREGGRLSRAFADYPYMLPSVRQMVATGEEAGKLYPVMLRLAEYYDKEVDRELKTLAAMIEPLALIVLGGVVGVIVSSVVLPLFRLAQALH